MDMQVYFYFLSFIHYGIRDKDFYCFNNKITECVNKELEISVDINMTLIYNAITLPILQPVNTNKLYERMGHVLSLCLQSDDQSLKLVNDVIQKHYKDQIQTYISYAKYIKQKYNYTNDIIVESYIQKKSHISNIDFKHEYECNSISSIFDALNNISYFGYNLQYIKLFTDRLIAASGKTLLSDIKDSFDIINLSYFIHPDNKQIFNLCNFIAKFNDDDNDDDIESIKRLYPAYSYMLNQCATNSAAIDSIIENISYEYFMFNEIQKMLFKKVIGNYVHAHMYNLIISVIKSKNITGASMRKMPAVTIVDEQIIKVDPDMNTGIFAVGIGTIDKMNTISMEITSDNLDKMSDVIVNLKKSVEKYKKYSTIGWWGKIFKSDIEIKANITIAVLDFENLLDKGDLLVKKLSNQYETFNKLYDDLKDLHNKFDDDIVLLESYLVDDKYSASDKQRLLNRKNDLLAAQTLSHTTALQYELAKNNIGILIDKFTAIEKILKPAIEMNMKLDNTAVEKISNVL